MCFSAPVSFLTSAGLAAAGAGSLKLSTKKTRWLATVPFIFAIQQLIEGLQWVVDKPSTASTVLAYGFLFFAYLWWPTYIPIGVYLHEQNPKRKKILQVFAVLGILLSAGLFVALLVLPLELQVLEHHIYYNIAVPLALVGAIYYVAIVAGSFFLSTDKYFNIFGIFVILSAVLATWIESSTFTSVWCFFAAVLSSLTLYYCYKHRKT